MGATIRDLVAKTGLSLGTISNYLNGVQVKKKNQELIEQAIEDMDYQFNQTASALKSKRSKIIGLIIPSLDLTFSIRLMVHFENIFSQYNYMLSVCVVKGENAKQDKNKLNLLLQQNVDGLIVVPPANNEHLETWLAKLKNRKPLLVLDRLLPNIALEHQLVVDNANVSTNAIQGLLNKGHRDIAIILGDKGGYTSVERLEGYKQALKQANTPIQANYIQHGEFTHQGGYQAIQTLMALSKPPTAIFITNYDMTLGCVEYMNEHQVRIGEDMTLIGFDLNELNKVFVPHLAMVIQPMEDIASHAARMILKAIENNTPININREFNCSIDWGESIKQLEG